MKELKAVHKYFYKYRVRLILGILFITISNIFAVMPPVIIRNVLDQVYDNINIYHLMGDNKSEGLFSNYIIKLVMWNGIILLAMAFLRGLFMFFMRQTIIVMSRHIEYDQKNEIFYHYQRLNTAFFKSHSTGDLMNRMAEDVGRVRQYTGPVIMYGINLIVLIIMAVWGMVRVSPSLTLYVLLPLPILALTIFYVNKIIHKKSEIIQEQLSTLTTNAQESYSGIRVIKSFVQEENMYKRFEENSEIYRKNAISLAKTEAIYFPSMNIFIGLSMILTIFVGGYQAINDIITPGNIAEFILYITLLQFPFSSLGWTASMIQRAAASQKRLNEFLETEPTIVDAENASKNTLEGNIEFKNVSFTYPHTGITALKNINLKINAGERIAIIGKSGSGKSTLAHLLLRMYDVEKGKISFDDINIKNLELESFRKQISYVPQEVFLFSDTIKGNIAFGVENQTFTKIEEMANIAAVAKDITQLKEGYDTVVGERGVMLSGGQKQRVAIARALNKEAKLLIMDDSLSAVDNRTETEILQNLDQHLKGVTSIIITHRIFKNWTFDKIIILDKGQILEQGTHNELINKQGYYSKLYNYQLKN